MRNGNAIPLRCLGKSSLATWLRARRARAVVEDQKGRAEAVGEHHDTSAVATARKAAFRAR
jgi:hypothetical protein